MLWGGEQSHMEAVEHFELDLVAGGSRCVKSLEPEGRNDTARTSWNGSRLEFRIRFRE